MANGTPAKMGLVLAFVAVAALPPNNNDGSLKLLVIGDWGSQPVPGRRAGNSAIFLYIPSSDYCK